MSYNLITSITPGPNNIVALNAAGSVGLRRSQPILWGMFSGLTLLLVFCGLFSAAAVSVLPGIMPYLRWLGAIYILWLAWETARSQPETHGGSVANITFWRGFILQLVNVKAIIWGLSTFTSYVLPHARGSLAILGFALLMACIANACALLWASFGLTLSSLFARRRQTLNLVMALLLAGNALSLLLS